MPVSLNLGNSAAGGDPYAVNTGAGAYRAVDNNSKGTSTTAGNSSASTNQTANTTGTQTTDTNQTTSSLNPGQIAALNQIIASLTGQASQDNATRQATIGNVQGQVGQYSKASAFSDAQGLIAQQTRRTLESLLPSISHAAEDAGSSGGALRALLMQDAANKAAESSSALGVNAATQYGGVATNLDQVLQHLLSDPTGSTTALLNAFNVMKGATTTTNGTQTTTKDETTNTAGTTNTSSNQNNTENKSVDYAPFQVTNGGGNNASAFSAPSSPTAPTYYGPSGGGGLNLSNDVLSSMSTSRAFDGMFFD